MSESSIRVHGKGGEGTMCESEKSPNTKEFIDEVCIEKLEKAVADGEMDASSAKLLDAEKEYILAWRNRSESAEDDGQALRDLTGIALSGGGIRSATFSLGVLQALAKRNLLKQIDYLSTVSGGGYIGSSLTWLTSELGRGTACGKDGVEFGVGRCDFPYGTEGPTTTEDETTEFPATDDPTTIESATTEDPSAPGGGSCTDMEKRNQKKMLKFLRQHGNYLTPGKGISLMSGFAIVLRGMLLNLLVWVPLLVALMTALLWYPRSGPASESAQISLYLTIRTEWSQWLAGEAHVIDTPFFDIVLGVSLLLGIAFVFGSIVYSLITRIAGSRGPWRYRARRWVEKIAGRLLWALATTFVIGSLPLVARWLAMQIDEFGGVSAIVAGIVSGVWAYINSGKKEPSVVSPHLIASVGAALFIYGVLLSAYQVGVVIFELANDQALRGWFGEWIDPWGLFRPVDGVVIGLVIFGFALGWFVNLNYISIHRFYRDRLMEAFMPDIDKAMDDVTGSATGADGALLHEIHVSDATSGKFSFENLLNAVRGLLRRIRPRRTEKPRAPYHIINTNVVLVDSGVRTWRMRGGDSFILSPKYCGSNATGWCPTDQFMGGEMKLATAMAISGAAANPNTGVGGRGVTRSRLVSLLMALLNFRLGYWVSTPRKRWMRLSRPNHFLPGLFEIFVRGYHEKRGFLQLSDGGHFENLGLYELVRRRLKLIIVCDGSADPDFTFSDFLNAVQRARTDFGVRIELRTSTDSAAGPDEMRKALASLIPDCPAGYPRGVDLACHGHLVGTITYPGRSGKPGETGVLIYLKTIMIPGLDLAVLGYKGAHRAFPDETTADQFFSEEQFEAYRVLGYRVAMKMVEKVELEGQPLNVWIGTKRAAFENA